MRRIIIFTLAVLSCALTAQGQEKYQASWESLSNHNPVPEWFADAKFGIYFHWGVYSVAEADGEWYPRNMHFIGHAANRYHRRTYGEINDFGYHDLVPLFTAEKFNAKKWVSLFEKAGARFVGPVAEHHDGFAMWDSECTPWNAQDMGPKRDIVGLIAEQARKHDMKLITTFHHARNLQRYQDEEAYEKEYERVDLTSYARRFHESHYPYFTDTPTRRTDSDLPYLYGNMEPEKWHKEVWLGKLKEVIDNYDPDLIWFDGWLPNIPEQYRQEFCAYYLNQAATKGQEVGIICKNGLPTDFTIDNLEKSRKSDIDTKTWETDETISYGSWSYTRDLPLKSSADLIHVLVDIVSKNGVLLLNVSPKYDGTIPADQEQILLDMGAWLKENGEAIYSSRPWYTFGEGPTQQPEGAFKNYKLFEKLKYTKEDIRYTTQGNIIYATVLGAVGKGDQITLTAFNDKQLKIKKITCLGRGKIASWEQDATQVKIVVDKGSNNLAEVYKIEMK